MAVIRIGEYVDGNTATSYEDGRKCLYDIMEVVKSENCLLYTSPSPRDTR